jgi:hypothetical protein
VGVELSNLDLPSDSYRWNRAIRGAFKKGMLAQQEGKPIGSCPYGDKRKSDGRLSWSRSFITAWEDGWRWAAKFEKQLQRHDVESNHVDGCN